MEPRGRDPSCRRRGEPLARATSERVPGSPGRPRDPVAASVACTVLASRLVARPTGAQEAVWWVLMAATSTTVLVVVDTVARRLLPLATLLRLSLAFPDRAPSRFSVAFRAGTTRNLKRQVARAQEHHTDADLAASAERILVLAAALSAHDRGTRHHSERVRAYCDLIAEELRLSGSDRDRLRWAALLHDVGKLEVSGGLLRKAGALDSEEWDEIRRHPGDGARIAAPLAGWLGPWAKAIEQHHEQWGGAGYPNGLSGADISLGARIVAVADAFEVMTAPRSYRRPVGANGAREELAHGAGEQFDPAVVRAFLNVSIGRLRWTIGPVAWLAHVPFVALASGRRRVIDGVRVVGAGGALAGLGTLVVGGIASPTDGRPASSQSTPSASAQLQRGRTDRSAAMSSYPTSTLPDVASIGGQAEGGAGTTAGPAVDTSGPPEKDKSRKRPLQSVRSASGTGSAPGPVRGNSWKTPGGVWTLARNGDACNSWPMS